MSVLKARRTTSKAEYVNTANQIYVETLNFLTRMWLRSANYNNNNNFCNVNTDGSANNNNARNAAALAPGFCDAGSHGVADR